MKKLLICLLAAILVLAAIPVMGVTAVDYGFGFDIPAPDNGSFWTTYRDTMEYNVLPGEPFTPTAGYRYDSEGFHTISPDYENTTPKYTVQTSEPYDISKGFYMELRMDEFAYDGGMGCDEWISFFISDTPTIWQGSTVINNYWCNLIRGKGNGLANAQSFVTTKDTETNHGWFTHKGDVAVEAPMDDDGREHYTFELIPQGGNNYSIRINGVEMLGAADYSAAISQYEECYIGITVHTAMKNSKASFTILKQGTSKTDAVPLTSGPSKEPETSSFSYGDMMDSSLVPTNQPALLFNADYTNTMYGEPRTSNCIMTPNADGSVHVTATDIIPYFSWSIRNEITYEAVDFPVFAMMLRNYNGDDGGVYYCAGDVLSPTNACTAAWSQWDLYEYVDSDGNICQPTAREYDVDDDWYVVVTVDLTGLNEWGGRINSIRPDFRIWDLNNPDCTEFDIPFMGFFRSIEEAFAYSDGYITSIDGDTPAETAPVEPETKPVESVTESPAESESEATTESEVESYTTGTPSGPVETTTEPESIVWEDPTTESEITSDTEGDAPETTSASDADTPESVANIYAGGLLEGCMTSVASGGTVLALLLMSGAWLALRKKD